MPNKANMNDKIIITLANAWMDSINDDISLLMLGMAFRLRSGLRTLRFLSAFKLEFVSTPGNSLATPTTTTKKSSQFHASLIYEFLCQTKPYEITLQINSIMKTKVKKISILLII